MGVAGPWRTGVAVLNYDNRPHDLAYPTFRPALLLHRAGFELHCVGRGSTPSRDDVEGLTGWVEAGSAGVARRVLALRPELLFVEGHSYGVALGTLARRSWVRNPAPAGSPAARRLQRLGLRAFDAVSFTNPFYERRWKLRPERLVDLPHPIDVAWWAEPVAHRSTFWGSHGLPVPAGPVLACIANLVRLKRQPEILRALAPLLQARPDVVLLFVGHAYDQQVKTELEDDIRRLGLADQVRLTGGWPTEDVRELLGWTALTILNSETEMQAMIAFEALAAGVPTIIPAIPQLTSLFPSLPAHRGGDELRANVERLLDDAGARASAVERSRPRLGWADVRRHDELFATTVERLLGRPVISGSSSGATAVSRPTRH